MNWEIRIATSEDAPQIVDLIRLGIGERSFHNREVSTEDFLMYAFDKRMKGFDLLLCQTETEIVGYIDSLIGKRGVGRILGIYVKPEYRRKGIGEALIEEIIDKFTIGKCHKARLQVFADNQGAFRFYTKLNFVQEGYLQKDQEKRDAIIMSRFLE